MRGRSIHELLRDYQDARGRERELPKELARRLADYERFVRSRSHVFQRDPAQVFAQGVAQPRDSAVGADFRRLVEEKHGPERPWLQLRNVPETDTQRNLLATIEIGTKVNAVAWVKFRGKPCALAGCDDGCLRLYDLGTGLLVEPILRGHTREVTAVALAPDGGHALSASWDGTLRWWDLAAGRCLRTLEGHTDRVRALALAPDGGHALSGSADSTLRWWDLGAGRCLHTLKGHNGSVRAVALAPDGGHALSGSWDGTLRWWDLGPGRCLHALEGHTKRVSGVALSPDGGHALSGSSDGTLRWWDLDSGRCLAVFTCDFPVTAVALSPQRPYLAVAGDSRGRVYFFDVVESDKE